MREEIAAAVRLMDPVPVYFGLELVRQPGVIDITPALVADMVGAGRAADAAGANPLVGLDARARGRASGARVRSLMPDAIPALEVVGLSRRFPGVVALDDISLRIRSPEVHTLAGQNGAGKSTLIKILSGALAPSAGDILVGALPSGSGSPVEAIALGIATITQEISLVPTSSVAENILIGRLPLRRGRVDWAAMRVQARRVLDGIGFDIDPDTAVSRLTVAAAASSRDRPRPLAPRPHRHHGRAHVGVCAAREVDRLLDTVERLPGGRDLGRLCEPSHGRGVPDLGFDQRVPRGAAAGDASQIRDQPE